MITPEKLQELIQGGETLYVEFKSDRRQMSDSDIYKEIVALANAAGGVLLIGVEDNGRITGSRPRHGAATDPLKLQSAIFNNTVPSINTRISRIRTEAGEVLAIEVDPYPEPCATMNGTALRRVIGPDGKPQTLPFYPRDQRSRRTDLGLLDFSAQELEDLTLDDLDPLEFERLRQMIASLRGDQALLELSDEELVKALRLVESRGRRLVPNVAGVLLLGRQPVLHQALPTHQVNFQVLDEQENVRVNDLFEGPLLKVIQEIETRFAARNEERETLVGMIRLPVPDYSPVGFREAMNNALLHRDYSRLGAIYIQWRPDQMLLTNPGGFPAGITAENILVHEPKPRNPRLAEAFRRIGLVEQTGRGVDKIYMGQLRYGRPAPDYSRSDEEGVRVLLRGGKASLEFAAFVYQEDEAGKRLKLDDLLVLNELFFERRIDVSRTARLIQKGENEARTVLERLHERGLIEGRGVKSGRYYMLSAALYQRFKMQIEYVRAKGFEPLQMEQMIVEYLIQHGEITRGEVEELCRLGEDQAYRMIQQVKKKYPQIQLEGSGRGARYRWNEKME